MSDLVATGIGGLYVCGGTGEGVLLSPAKRRTMAQAAIAAVAGRVPVMVHIGAIDTATGVDLTRHANELGADAVSAVPPFYYQYTFAAIAAHYRALASASRAPLYIYHIPGATGTSVTPAQLLELCAIDGISGFKYTAHDLFFLSRVMAVRDPGQVNVLSGPDELFLPCLSLGADGAIGTTYNFMPRLYIDIRRSALAGDLETARKLQFRANAIIDVLIPYGVIPATKALLAMLGHHVGNGVLPMPPIVGGDAEKLHDELTAAGAVRVGGSSRNIRAHRRPHARDARLTRSARAFDVRLGLAGDGTGRQPLGEHWRPRERIIAVGRDRLGLASPRKPELGRERSLGIAGR